MTSSATNIREYIPITNSEKICKLNMIQKTIGNREKESSIDRGAVNLKSGCIIGFKEAAFKAFSRSEFEPVKK